MPSECVQRLAATFLSLEFRATGAAQERAALLDDATHRTCIQWLEIFLDQSCITVLDAEDFPTQLECATGYCPDRSVHTGRVAATGQYSGTFHHFLLMKVGL